LAKLIEGSAIFIGNQSSPFWIAASLNHPAIQETSPDIPDSIVPYKDTHYSIDGDFAPIDFLIKKALDKNIRIS
jgi:ADP-heptose:LPS heptosyltransferase